LVYFISAAKVRQTHSTAGLMPRVKCACSLRGMTMSWLLFRDSGVVIIGASSLVHARLLAAANGLGRASHFVEGGSSIANAGRRFPRSSSGGCCRPLRRSGFGKCSIAGRKIATLMAGGERSRLVLKTEPRRRSPDLRRLSQAGHSGAIALRPGGYGFRALAVPRLEMMGQRSCLDRLAGLVTISPALSRRDPLRAQSAVRPDVLPLGARQFRSTLRHFGTTGLP